MKAMSFLVAASLVSALLQACGSGGDRSDTTDAEGPAVSVVQAATDNETLAAKVSFTLNSSTIAAKDVHGLRFAFTLPEGFEPTTVPNPLFPQSDTVEIDTAKISLTESCANAVAMGSYRRSDRRVEVALVDADGLESIGAVLGSIGFTATAPDRSTADVARENVVLEEVIGLEDRLPTGSFTLVVE